MQNIPVVLAVSQSADPQRQLPSFADVPSAMLHDAVNKQLDRIQKYERYGFATRSRSAVVAAGGGVLSDTEDDFFDLL